MDRLALVLCWIRIHVILVNGLELRDTNTSETYHDAANKCRNFGKHCTLPHYQTDQEIISVQEYMKQGRVPRVWLAVTKETHKTWVWQNDKPVGNDFEAQRWKDYMNCGLLHLRDKLFEGDDCSIQTYGYICSVEDPDWCVFNKGSSSKCLTVGNWSYTVDCSSDNWYDARHRCESIGMNLALIPNPALIERLAQEWYKKSVIKCRQVWVGFRREDWIVSTKSNQTQDAGIEKGSGLKYFWAPGEPKRDDCAIVYQDRTNNFLWRSENCSATHNTLCVCKTAGRNGAPEPLGTQDSSDRRNNKFRLGLAIGIPAVALLIICVIGTVYFCTRRKRRKRMRREEKNKPDVSTKDSKPLITDTPAVEYQAKTQETRHVDHSLQKQGGSATHDLQTKANIGNNNQMESYPKSTSMVDAEDEEDDTPQEKAKPLSLAILHREGRRK